MGDTGQKFPMWEGDYRAHCERGNDGICLACGEIQYSCVEPDAEGYKCGTCGEMHVCGVEQANLLGRIEFVPF